MSKSHRPKNSKRSPKRQVEQAAVPAVTPAAPPPTTPQLTTVSGGRDGLPGTQTGETGDLRVVVGVDTRRADEATTLPPEDGQAAILPAASPRLQHPQVASAAEIPSPRRPISTSLATPDLSLCMIVRDEEARLGECLRSIRPYVDEMVVVDTGSADRTREIAWDCGARVFEMPWPDSFALARNESLGQARGKWIFWLDADDVISPENGQGLRQLTLKHPRCEVAYQVQVRIPPGDGQWSESVVDHVKLFPNRPDLRFEHRIHEQILPSIRRAGLEVRFSDLFVVHRNYDRSDEGQAKKRRRDFRLLELDFRDHPDHPFVLFNLGMTYLYATKEFEVAAHFLRWSLERSDWKDSIVRKAYAMLCQARTCQGEWGLALAANEEGRSYYPEDAELLYQAGQLYQQVHDFDAARRALERLLAGDEGPHYRSADAGLRTYRGEHELALLYRRMGDPAHCEQVLRALASAYPFYAPAQLDLAETLRGVGRAEEGGGVLAALPNGQRALADRERRQGEIAWRCG